MWYYKSPIGLMKIYKNSSGRYSLQIKDNVYGSYNSAVAAADDVYMFATGCHQWDSLEGKLNPPSDIHEWEIS
ncbi:MAG: hypothetical protein NC548_33385 [Lachnospiraceae bacterium]|nr:hypothetical protein [Lachnospiraceae bacterium]